MPKRTKNRLVLIGSAVLAAALAGTLTGTLTALAVGNLSAPRFDGTGGPVPGTAAGKAARGQVMTDLRAGGSRCPRGYEVIGEALCSPGPDPSSAGVDVRSVDRGKAPALALAAAAAEGVLAADGSLVPLPASVCGTDGPRVQALYVRPATVPDRSVELASSLRIWAMTADKVFEASAAKTGGVRHIRWVTDASCLPKFESVTVSDAAVPSLTRTIRELKRKGYNRSDRRYVLWMDAAVYCGVGTTTSDDRAGSRNAANRTTSYGRVDRACWGGFTEAHELVHGLGGVQLSAPHSNGGYHCTDENDRMCYAQGTAVMTQPCPAWEERLLDCGNDDYFSTAPEPGSYLATHWNVANSPYLSR